MPTVLRIGRFRFFFYSNENAEPPHIHVKVAENEAKFGSTQLIWHSAKGLEVTS